jgi:CHAT domain-containing protein
MRTIGDARSEAQAYHAIARVHLARAAPSAARDHLDRALRLARSTGDVHVEADVLLELARLDRDHGALGDARTHVEDALRIVEGLRARVVRQPLRTVLLAARQEYYETAVDTLMRLHASQGTGGFDALALETSERARARGLLDLLAESGADVREGVDAALLDRERSLRQRLNTKSDRQVALAAAALTAPAAVELGREIDETIADLQAVEASVRRQSPRYAALTEPPVLSVNDLRRDVLDDDTALVEYALGDEQSFAWALTTTGLVSARLPPRGVIERAARDVYDAMTARSQRAPGESAAAWVQRVRGADWRLDAAAAALSDLVLAPVAAGLGKPRLLVVSDGALAFLPFGVLPDPAAPDRRPLLVSHEIVTAPSASVLALLRRELAGRPAPPLTAAVIADPVFTADDPRVTRKGAAARTPVRAPAVATNRSAAPGVEPLAAAPDQIPLSALARLVATRDDARAIRALAPGKRSMEAFDFQANLATATSPVLAQYSIVHFATHTLIDTERPELSAIVLSLVTEAGDPRPGLLRLHDIYNLRLPVDLVVLSACQTALGRAVRGEGLLGLSRGFMYAGAPRVVVSLWKVDDQATSVLMHHFYEAMLRGGLAPAAALRAAQRRMRDDPAWSHPFHWAGFVLQGEWRPR